MVIMIDSKYGPLIWALFCTRYIRVCIVSRLGFHVKDLYENPWIGSQLRSMDP